MEIDQEIQALARTLAEGGVSVDLGTMAAQCMGPALADALIAAGILTNAQVNAAVKPYLVTMLKQLVAQVEQRRKAKIATSPLQLVRV